MAIRMTDLCRKGVDLIWKQCDEAQYPQGLEYLRQAAGEGDAEALFFLGHCYSWGDGAVGFNEKRAYECYREGARAGSYRCVLGAMRAGQYDEELKAAAKFPAEKCVEEVIRAAQEGESFAAYQIARAFEWEDIFAFLPEKERDARQSLYWYKKAANGGIVEAIVKAGKCYLSGRFTVQDRDKAISYAERAAALGHPWGLYHMGLFERERGNVEMAFDYFQAAAIQGDHEAPFYLGMMYLSGDGVERNVEDAVQAFEMAASREETKSLAKLGDIFYQDEVVERDDGRAFYWYSRAYAAGDKRVAFPLAHLYLRPSEARDCQKAIRLFREAAETETDGAANLVLGNLYLEGTGCEADVEEALFFYETGAGMGNPECMEILGCLYFAGEKVRQDYGKAFYWLNRCLEEGTLQSYSKLAFLYLEGYGCDPDEEKARELFERAAKLECDGYAYYELGYLCERRKESQEDLEQAVEYYEMAAEMGDEVAAERLSHFKRTVFGKWKVID